MSQDDSTNPLTNFGPRGVMRKVTGTDQLEDSKTVQSQDEPKGN